MRSSIATKLRMHRGMTAIAGVALGAVAYSLANNNGRGRRRVARRHTPRMLRV